MSNSPQEAFNTIAAAENMPALEEAIAKMKSLPDAQRQEVIQALEKVVESEFEGMSAQDFALMEGITALSFLIDGDEDVIFEMQATVTAAKAVLDEKGDNASPILKVLSEKVAELSDDEFNSVSGLVKAFKDVSITVAKLDGATKPAPKNPFKR